MAKKNWRTMILALLLAIVLTVPNIAALPALAAGVESGAVTEETAQTVEQNAPVEAPVLETADTTDETTDSEDPDVGELKLVYGDADLADEDAMVLLIMGDGFTAEEQDKFYEEAAKTAENTMSCSPYDEFSDVFKIYALGTVSKESGAKGDKATTKDEADADTRDTYFGASFWSWGMQRLIELSREGEQKGYALQEKYLPLADFNLFIVNSDTYGGSGGNYCIASLNSQSLDMMLHEMGHTIADLADEYYAPGYEREQANLTKESDPTKVRWARFVGKNGIGVYDWGGQANIGWYIPSLNCKMQYLSTSAATYEFCEVCKEELRKAFCANSNVTKLFFQTYADEFIEGDPVDMSQYFILRKGESEITGDKLGNLLTLTYYDEDGNELDGAPSESGTYTVKGEFAGNDEYDPCSATGEFTVDAAITISISISSKVYDGEPAELTYSVEFPEGLSEEDYDVEVSYYGYENYTYDSSSWVCAEYYCYMDEDGVNGTEYYYLSNYVKNVLLAEDEYEVVGGPAEVANYTVYVDVYDMNGDWVAEKSKDYRISFKTTKLADNEDNNYYGALEACNNKTILIYGEGFTAEEQDKFDELAAQLTDTIRNTEPIKETQLYFNFTAINTVSNVSGIGTEVQDTVFRLYYAEDGQLKNASYATRAATNLAYYDIDPYYSTCIIIVNDENLAESTVYGTYYNNPTYHYFFSIVVSPDEAGMEYAAAEIVNHLNWEEPGYRPETEAEKEAQRLDLISALHYEYAPIIVSRAYDETFVETGNPVDLTPYFEVYYNGELLPNVELALTYYDEAGNELDGAPSKAGTYSVLAKPVPYDPDNPKENYWTWYEPEDGSEGLWLGAARGYTTFTINEAEKTEPSPVIVPPKKTESTGGTNPSEETEPDEEELYDDVAKKTASNAWYFDAVYEVRDLGLMQGVGNNKFEPTRDMTRAEAAVIVVKLAGIDPDQYAGTDTVFTDVPASHWGINYIVAAYENGLISGRGNGIFDPDAKITREEFTAMLVAAAGIDADKYVDVACVFPDVPANSWATKYIVAAYENGLVSGFTDGTFGFGKNITRCEVAVMLSSASKLNLI